MIPYNILDLSPICEGYEAADSFRNTTDLAQHAETWGYTRYWLAEHHNMPGIASSATSVLLAHVAAHTTTLRVGSGGVMLPNHAPLVIAEQFGALHALYGDRIDLGLGRAPGTDMATMRALRRGKEADRFPEDVIELMTYLGPRQDGSTVHAIPGENSNIPVWILGSSLYGAQLAAHFGLPYAFASHFAPDALDIAPQVYRDHFKPSPHLDAPCFMLAVNVWAADTDEEATRLKTSHQQSFANLRTGRPGKLPRPVDRIEDHIAPAVLAMVNEALSVSACGSPETVKQQLSALIARHKPQEIIINGSMHDHQARLRSFEIAAEAMRSL